jgi:hypothetical protein
MSYSGSLCSVGGDAKHGHKWRIKMDLTGGGRGTFQSTNRTFDRLFCNVAGIWNG